MISRVLPPPQILRIVWLLTIDSLCTSMTALVMGFFIIDALGASTWYVSLFAMLSTGVTFVLNRWAGKRFDKGTRVFGLLRVSIAAHCAATLALVFTHSLLVLFAIVLPLMGLANVSLGLTFALGRVSAERSDAHVGRANAWYRAAVSVAWIIGPAASFTLIGAYGFQATFATASALGIIWFALLYWTVPRDFRLEIGSQTDTATDGPNWGLLIAAGICLMFVLTTSLFESAMPLYFIQDVKLPVYAPGLSLSFKCFLELFSIFAAPVLVDRFGVRRILIAAAILAIFTMVLYAQVSSIPELILVSSLDGIYYGLFAGVAVTYCQSFAPDKLGSATAVFANSFTIGSMLGSVAMGFIASGFGFRAVVLSAAILAFFVLIIVVAEVPIRRFLATRRTKCALRSG